jgi:hypothetical protein
LYSQNQPRGIGLLSCTKDAILALHQGRPHRTARTKVAAVAGFEAQDVRPSHAADPEQRIIRRFDDFSARPMNVPLRAIILDRVKYHPEASELMICEGVALGRHSEHRNTFDRDALVEIPAQAVDGAARSWHLDSIFHS